MFQPHEDIIKLDCIQSNMLGLIVGIMQTYQITPHHVALHYAQCATISDTNTSQVESQLESQADNQIEAQLEVLSKDATCNDSKKEHQHHKKKFVSNRRAFRDCLSEGLVICSKHDKCKDDLCTKFHVHRNDMCPHAGRNNVCNDPSCEKIVIKACRKNKNCSDKSCSYRH